jgi:hypothetical protein
LPYLLEEAILEKSTRALGSKLKPVEESPNTFFPSLESAKH